MNVIFNKLVSWDIRRRMDCKNLFLIKKVMYSLVRQHIDFRSHYFVLWLFSFSLFGAES